MTVFDTGGPQGPREDWYCKCREVAPDRIGTVPVLRPARNARCLACYTDAPWVIPAFDTGEPQGSPPTSTSPEGSEGGGASLNLDRLARQIEDALDYAGDYMPGQGVRADGLLAVLALVERVRTLEAVAEAARELVDNTVNLKPEFRDPDDPFELLIAALAAAGGPDGQ